MWVGVDECGVGRGGCGWVGACVCIRARVCECGVGGCGWVWVSVGWVGVGGCG